jgi:tRNA threonylcarbamoyladenosine dehydratase
MEQFRRNLLTFGKSGQDLLLNASVAILGIGGVGSFAVESLVRSGVGRLILIDKDVVDITNINRQLHATLETVGQSKVDLMEARIKTINPNCEVIKHNLFFNHDTAELILNDRIDFFIDASDTITFKIVLIKECLKRKIKFISVMGAANKLDPTQFEIADISKTSYDPIAKVIRTKLRKEKIYGKVPVVYSKEKPIIGKFDEFGQVPQTDIRKATIPPASNSFVPPVAGMVAASYVIRELLKNIKIERVGVDQE